MSLLAWTAEFENYGHDGRSTYKELLRIRGVRHLLMSEAGLSPETVKSYGRELHAPRLEILATVAAVSRQPLHRVILGQLAPWSGAKISEINISKISRKRDWAVLEREFELLADSETFIPLKDVCAKLNISRMGAKMHFPDLADRIVQRGKLIRSESLEASKRAMLESMRPAFRLIHASGEYPSVAKIMKLSGADTRTIGKEYKKIIEEEWLRVGGRPI
ncbi:hypothetical protein [Paraburkholderia guartelaensis]|uniref:hypothetical protein n=1 Tax=Paraburkholderia guartelaensis TaxID=2546446 RepID=UPI002AB60A9B|nr:hypothetical protein [Paraburkholderia guartelaensis]